MLERDWELLKIVYEEKSLTRASKRLYLSQPAVTRRLQMIEQEFGVKVVKRSSKGVVFTEEGKYLVKCAQMMIENLNNIKVELGSMNKKVEGVIRIGTANNFSQKTLPILLSQYKKYYPQVEFDITTGWSEDIYKALCDKRVDIAFVRGEYRWSQREKTLFTASISIISREEIGVEDLPNLNRIDYSSDGKLKGVIDDWWKERFTKSPLKSIKIDSIASCIEMVKQGLGYAIVPSTIIKPTDEFYRIDLRNKNGEKIVRRTRAFYSKEWEHSKLGETFLRFLEE